MGFGVSKHDWTIAVLFSDLWKVLVIPDGILTGDLPDSAVADTLHAATVLRAKFKTLHT
jgi:hypothetical protein